MIQKLKSHCSRCGLTNLLPFPICYFITAGHCRHKIFLLAWLTSINFYCQSTQAPFLLPRWLGGKESACQCRKCRFDSWSGKILCRRKWQPTSVFLPGNFHGQRSLAGCSPWIAESDMTACMHCTTISISQLDHYVQKLWWVLGTQSMYLSDTHDRLLCEQSDKANHNFKRY